MIRQTCLEMLEQRGYSIKSNEEEKIIAEKDEQAQICVFLTVINLFNVDKYQEYLTEMNANNIKHSIIICNKITPTIQTMIKMNIDNLKIETFTETELSYNITKHSLVPLHENTSDEEATEVKEKLGTKLPILLKTDPICRFYNFKHGNIIKVHRKDGYIMYRIVK